MCEHLTGLDHELQSRGIKETFRGAAWGDNTREWVYYDCVLMVDKLARRFQFPDFVEIHVNSDPKSGMETGFYCTLCKDGVMGLHPQVGEGKTYVE